MEVSSMARIPVKLTRTEIVLPPRVAQKYRQRLEEMNAIGLQARAAGGVVKYKQEGGFLSNVPKGALGDIGSALVHIGSGDFIGGSEALRGPGVDSAASKAQAEADKVAETNQRQVALADQMIQLAPVAAEAGDYINGYLKFDEETEDSIQTSIDKKFGTVLTSIANIGAGAFDATRRIRVEARERIVENQVPQSYDAYSRLVQIREATIGPILESGALGVNPTDADMEYARNVVVNLDRHSRTWIPQLTDFKNRAAGNYELELAQQTGNVQDYQSVQTGGATVDVPDGEPSTGGLEDDGVGVINIDNNNITTTNGDSGNGGGEGSSADTAILISSTSLRKREAIAALNTRPRDQWVTIRIKKLFREQLITDTVGNILDELEDN